MNETVPPADEQLLNELEPTAIRLFERHMKTAKEWFPHELVPWGEGKDYAPGEEFDPTAASLDEVTQAALLLNTLTEDNLPHYHVQITGTYNGAEVWDEWNNRWTAEEGRHAIVMRDYLAVTKSIDMRQLERGRMRQVSLGQIPDPAGVRDGVVYVALQELATRVSHRNTGTRLGEQGHVAGETIMNRVGNDENLHHLFYRDLATAAIEIDPSGMVRAIDRQVRGFEMPGAGIEDFKALSRLVASCGILDTIEMSERVFDPVVKKHWRLEDVTGLNSDAEYARDATLKHLGKLSTAAKWFKAKRTDAQSSTSN